MQFNNIVLSSNFKRSLKQLGSQLLLENLIKKIFTP